MALCLLENRDYLGFQMIFKVWLNQNFSNCNTRLWTNKYRLRAVTVYFTFSVPELWPFFSLKIGTFSVCGCYLKHGSTTSVQILAQLCLTLNTGQCG
jgi:hypothetical protein